MYTTKFQTLKAEATRIKDFYSGHVNETFLELTDKFLGKIPRIKKHVNVDDIHFLGCGKEKVLSCQEIQLIADQLFVYCESAHVVEYERMCSQKDVFTVLHHKTEAKRRNCYVLLNCGRILELVSFCVLNKSNGLKTTPLTGTGLKKKAIKM